MMNETIAHSAENVGTRLRHLRTALALSQSEFARATGINASAISNYERGDSRPGIAQAAKICARFGVTLDWQFLGKTASLRYEVVLKLGLHGDGKP